MHEGQTRLTPPPFRELASAGNEGGSQTLALQQGKYRDTRLPLTTGNSNTFSEGIFEY